jgi:hypothetical protein
MASRIEADKNKYHGYGISEPEASLLLDRGVSSHTYHSNVYSLPDASRAA